MDWIYDSRNVSGSSTNKFNIKPAEYGEKIKLALYYKGKKIGKDSCDYNDEADATAPAEIERHDTEAGTLYMGCSKQHQQQFL